MINLRRVPLLWKIWLSTSVALTALFVIIGIFLQRSVQDTAVRSLEEEARASAQAYDGLLEARAAVLQSIAAVFSVIPAAGDAKAPQNAVWKSMAEGLETTAFVELTDSQGEMIRVLAGDAEVVPDVQKLVAASKNRFPKQASGFFVHHSMLYQVVLTPLYERRSSAQLSGVLIAGFLMNHAVAEQFKTSTGGSEFIFASRGQIYGSTLDDRATGAVVRNVVRNGASRPAFDGTREWMPLPVPLHDVNGNLVSQLFILRSFEGAREHIAGLRRRFLWTWIGAVIAGLALTYFAVRRIVRPIQELDRAASEVGMQNYEHRISVDSDDELGRLATSFNHMCESLQAAQAELIRRERIGTIGRLAGSIVHDLRNPLAAIWGGAEMLVDTNLTPEQSRRIAENIYRSARKIRELLDDLGRVSRGKPATGESWALRELVRSSLSGLEATAGRQGVKLKLDVPENLEVPADRARIEGVFVNLVQNSLDVMPSGGEVLIRAEVEGRWATVEVTDTGPGIAKEIRGSLFQPFVSHGKRNGLGLGLALARQTMLDHGGDLWASNEEGRGARFILRLPRKAGQVPQDSAS